MGQITAFWPRQRACRARPGLWYWSQCKEDRERGNGDYLVSGPESKMDIPDDFLCDRNGTDLYVEVRGTQDNGESVSLMPKAVEHARNHANSVLFVVHSVKMD
jgi:hypothetical protein